MFQLSLPQTVAAGARVSVQARAGYPLVEEYGVDVSPGSLTSLSLQLVSSGTSVSGIASCRQVNISRHSYSGCTSTSWQGASHGQQGGKLISFIFELVQLSDSAYSYSVTGCQRFCVQSAVEVDFSCAEAQGPFHTSCKLPAGTRLSDTCF